VAVEVIRLFKYKIKWKIVNKDSNNSYTEDKEETQLSYQKLQLIPSAKYENS